MFKSTWKSVSFGFLLAFGMVIIQMLLGFISVSFFFHYYGIETAVPFGGVRLNEIGLAPSMLTFLICYPSIAAKFDIKPMIKWLYGALAIPGLIYFSKEMSLPTEDFRFSILFFAAVLTLIGFLLRKRIRKLRYITLVLSFTLFTSIFVIINTSYRTQFNICDYLGESYAATYVLGENVYLVQCEIESNLDSQDAESVIKLYQNKFLVVNYFENDILKDNTTRFSRVVIIPSTENP